MALSDAVAAQVLGEIHTLAQRIDAQTVSLERTAKLTKDTASDVVAGIRQALRETETTMQAMQKGSLVEVRFATQMQELNRIANVFANAREDIPKEVRKIALDARQVASETLQQCRGEAAQVFNAAATETLNAATTAYKTELKALGAGIAAVAVFVAVMAGIAGYVMGKQTGFAMAQAEASAQVITANKKGQ